MAGGQEPEAIECVPDRVRVEVARLNEELRAHHKPPAAAGSRVDFAAQIEAALWKAGWQERMREQQVLLSEWARRTGQPGELRQAIHAKEREAFTQALIARARAAQWRREASQRAGSAVGVARGDRLVAV